MAYVLGYFAADGSMLRNKRESCFIEFTSTDLILLELVQKATGSSHKISIRKPKLNCKTAYRLQIGSKEWFKDLTDLGFTQNKSNTLVFPNIPSEFMGPFVRGYFDGDGCAYLKKHWSSWHKKDVWVFVTRFTSGSKEFLLDLLALLKQHGLVGGHLNTKAKGGFDLVFSRRDSVALYKLMYHTAQVSALFLPRKREKIEQAIEVLGLDKTCGRSSTG
ncbi:MAG: hypothetical protein JWN64_793 [Parcubacteria group bacterium]|nr:hypothetical protein [Parcubacteria group bacterium]